MNTRPKVKFYAKRIGMAVRTFKKPPKIITELNIPIRVGTYIFRNSKDIKVGWQFDGSKWMFIGFVNLSNAYGIYNFDLIPHIKGLTPSIKQSMINSYKYLSPYYKNLVNVWKWQEINQDYKKDAYKLKKFMED